MIGIWSIHKLTVDHRPGPKEFVSSRLNTIAEKIRVETWCPTGPKQLFSEDLGAEKADSMKEMTRLFVRRLGCKFLSINKPNPLGGARKAWFLHCVTWTNKIFLCNPMSVQERVRKDIPRTTFMLVSANKKSPPRIKSPLAYREASSALTISYHQGWGINLQVQSGYQYSGARTELRSQW